MAKKLTKTMVGSVIKYIQLDNVKKLQKSWIWEGKEYRVEAYFGTMRDGKFSPIIVMNVYEQGTGAKQVVDDNCDVWDNRFLTVSKEFGNQWYLYLRKHGFVVCE